MVLISGRRFREFEKKTRAQGSLFVFFRLARTPSPITAPRAVLWL